MFRVFIFIISLVISVNASIIHFEEEKYIEVLDNSIKKEGTLEFLDKKLKLKYKHSKRVLTYENDILTIQAGDAIQEIDLTKQLALKISFLLIESIHYNKIKVLEEYFIINKENNITFLKPKEMLINYIISVEYKKTKTLEYLTIHMTNGNKTTIRELND
jgi:hypothetical protein